MDDVLFLSFLGLSKKVVMRFRFFTILGSIFQEMEIEAEILSFIFLLL